MNYGYPTAKDTYIGDGVYVRDVDGTLLLAANSPVTDVIYLEDAVMVALIDYWKQARGLTKENEDAAR